MEKEKTAIQKLKDFAQKTHRTIDFIDKTYPSNALHPITYHRRYVNIPENRYNSLAYISFVDSRKLDNFSTFSGVFMPIDVSTETKICVRRRNIYHKMNLFGKKKYYKTGIESFDSKVVFDEFTAIGTNKIFTNEKIQQLILKAFDFDARLKVGINMLNLDFIPEMKNKSHLGIYSLQNWYTELSEIEILFNLGNQINRHSVLLKEPELIDQY